MLEDLSGLWTPAKSRPLLLGHRGARHAAPENTFAAFDLALDEGAEGVELDVRMNASGEVVVCHDVTLERVTEGLDLRAIHRLSARDCKAVRLAKGEPLPLLSDVLDWAERRHACVNVELKMDGPKRTELVLAVANLTRSRPVAGNVLISSFNPVAVLTHRALAPGVPSAWLVDSSTLAKLPFLSLAGNVALHPKHTLITAERLAAWKRYVPRIHTWTVNDPARARELAALGVACLITDNPGLLARALEPAAPVPNVDARSWELPK